MSNEWPAAESHIVVGLSESYNFMNYADPLNPTVLALSLNEPTTLVISLNETLIDSGWKFQETPFKVGPDYSVNFSSYSWLENTIEGEIVPHTKFRLVFECNRLGQYEYSLMFVDSHGQKIGLDPKIENGAGR